MDMTDDGLKDLGIDNVVHRKQILTAIGHFRSSSAQNKENINVNINISMKE